MDFITNSVTAKSRFHERNEDSLVCDDSFVVIADGMGGEACGDEASKIAVSTISSYLSKRLKMTCSEDQIRNLSFSAVFNADLEISNYIAAHPEAIGMGTTVVLLIHSGENLYITWCGDSRCYYYSPSKGLQPLTTDHSYVQQLIAEGKITVDESFSHPDNNLITNFVGGGEEVCTPEFASAKIDDDGVVILCSDGLSGYCRNEEIERELQRSIDDTLARRLLDLAVSKGSDDDITIVTLSPMLKRKKSKKSFLGWLCQ